MDQSPLSFAANTKRTYEILEPGSHYQKVWIVQPGRWLDKRQCIFQICLRTNGEQPRIAIIFGEQRKRIAEDERQTWHDDIEVYFQQNTWTDIEPSIAQVEQTLKQFAEKEFRCALFFL